MSNLRKLLIAVVGMVSIGVGLYGGTAGQDAELYLRSLKFHFTEGDPIQDRMLRRFKGPSWTDVKEMDDEKFKVLGLRAQMAGFLREVGDLVRLARDSVNDEEELNLKRALLEKIIFGEDSKYLNMIEEKMEREEGAFVLREFTKWIRDYLPEALEIKRKVKEGVESEPKVVEKIIEVKKIIREQSSEQEQQEIARLRNINEELIKENTQLRSNISTVVTQITSGPTDIPLHVTENIQKTFKQEVPKVPWIKRQISDLEQKTSRSLREEKLLGLYKKYSEGMEPQKRIHTEMLQISLMSDEDYARKQD